MSQWRPRQTKDNLLEALNNSKKIIVFDVETSGLKSETERIIQISGIKYIIENAELKEEDRLDIYIKPPFMISEKITELTGITNDFLFNKPKEEKVFPVIKDFFGTSPATAAYNSAFDLRFLKALYQRNGQNFDGTYDIDVLELARDILPKEDVENFKLCTIAKHCNADEGITFHSSIDDVIATSRLLSIFIRKYKESEKTNGLAEIRQMATINAINYWDGPSKELKRIYVNTDLGGIYYDIYRKVWKEQPDSKGCMDVIDMEQLRSEAFSLVDVKDDYEFSRFKGKYKKAS